ncbi:MAG: D-glycero-beta-D-manno-heptose 1-phosphate adenylyltransferase [Candidatus Omnitrophica bacterium]|jgi:D-beta-D-heptose 7-phosphate kinase/D-beta-D-heptose 1-phosphate adenosyltransferase|nr:D-glycero-beta-D-manno-heptose 1-phosphate adenylyltransferase [Candidatus Omnitrophota bacterium]
MSDAKIKSAESLKAIIRRLKLQGKKTAFTNGCFDILHYGHIKYLEEAKKNADILIVAVNDDGSVTRLKGLERPICPLKERMGVLAGLSSVDFVTSFSQDTPCDIIKYLRPDIILKGADYKIKEIAGAGFVKSYGGKVQRIRYLKGCSASGIIKRILARYGKLS